MISEYKHRLLSGKPCMIHAEFKPAMDLFCRYLEITGCAAYITSSHRTGTAVPGAIVKPAAMSNHLVGCAIDCNIYDKKQKLWNSADLARPAGEVLELINLVRRSGVLRWGGDFAPDRNGKTDPVHFDNALNIKNKTVYLEIFNQLYHA